MYSSENLSVCFLMWSALFFGSFASLMTELLPSCNFYTLLIQIKNKIICFKVSELVGHKSCGQNDLGLIFCTPLRFLELFLSPSLVIVTTHLTNTIILKFQVVMRCSFFLPGDCVLNETNILSPLASLVQVLKVKRLMKSGIQGPHSPLERWK